MTTTWRFWSAITLSMLLFVAGIDAATAQADMKNKEFSILYKKNRKEAVKYISTIHNGFSWFQVVSEKKYERKPLYCPPQQLSITDDQIIKVYRDYLKKYPNDDSIAALSLIEAFVFTFPCPN